MRVSRLEVFGFKSFMDRLVLPLDGGITGVVGPNGCGKSNIVDALRWVLGETKASSLRGGTLEDVIFNGTDKLRPLGLAEVTLTLRSESPNFFEDLISPQLEVEQVLKNVQKEIEAQEEDIVPLQDEGRAVKLRVIEGKLGGEAEVSEGEGDDEAVLSIDPDIELPESSDAHDPGEDVSTTILSRFAWLKSVSEVQITRRLYRSGESEFFINRVPCRLKDIKDFFRAVGLGARAYTIVAQGEVSRIVTSKPEERRLILEEAAGVVGFRDKIAASNRKLEETGHNITRLKDVISEVDRQVSNLKRQAARAQNRQQLKDTIEQLEMSVFREKCLSYVANRDAVQEIVTRCERDAESARNSLTALEVEESAHRTTLSALDQDGDSVRVKIDSLRQELLNRARAKSARTSRINELRAFNLARVTEIRRLEERRETLKSRETEAGSGIEGLRTQERDLQTQIEAIKPVSQSDLQQAAIALRNARERVRMKEGEIRTSRDKVVSNRSSLQALHDQIVAASPINQLKKTLQAEKVAALVPDVQVFVEGLVVAPQYARAVQAVLSERAAFLVTEHPENIASAFLAELAGKEKKGLGIGILKGGQGVPSTPIEGVPFPRVLDVIEVKPAFQFAANHLLHAVHVVETAAQAFEFFSSVSAESPQADVTLVTYDGDIITGHSFYSLRHDGGLIQLQNRVRELHESQLEFEGIEKRLATEREEIQREVGELETKQSELLKESEHRQRALRELSNQQATVRGRLQAEERLIQQVAQDASKIAHQIAEIEHKIEEGKREEESLVELSQRESSSDDASIEEEVKSLSQQGTQIDAQRKEGRTHISALATRIAELRRHSEKIASERSKAELDLQKLDLEQENIRHRVISEYGEAAYEGLTTESDAPRLNGQQVVEAEQEAMKIRTRIAREGEVDSSSIERYEEEAKRLADLKQQLADLEDAASVLKKTIERLQAVSESRFVSMFNAVTKNFSMLIPQLFGGGKGSLVLSDPTNPLESGIDIIMRPPGKKPKSIDLLSGGEKALCATALIFSMFLEKPSPLCVLDEVDAPLDEANLIRFLTLVKEMSSRTQFLVVTHNKRSMAMADNLIGVTMQQPGASKVISVSLQEAYSQVA